MKDVKTRPSEKTPRILSDSARAPKELARRSILTAKEKAKEVAQRQQPQSESPEQYAEVRVEQTAEEVAYKTGSEISHQGKKLVRNANEARKQAKEIRNESETARSSNTTATGSRPASANTPNHTPTMENNAYRAGRERVVRNVKTSQRNARTVRQTASTTKGAVKTTAKNTVKTTAKNTVKTAKKTVKTAQQTVKTAEKTVKTTAKAAEKTAQAAAKAAQAAAKAAQAAAKAAAAAAKAVAKAVVAVVKWIIAAVKALIAAIAAGGWVAVVVVIVVVLIIALLAVFGVFSANETSDGGKPMSEAIDNINSDFKGAMTGKIAELTAQNEADNVEIVYEGDMESLESTVPNWVDVIGVYAIKLGMDEVNPVDVTVVTPENIEKLTAIFNDMNSVSYRTETETETITVTDEYGAIVLDDNGDPMTETTTTLIIYIDVASMDYWDGAAMYNFSDSQMEMLNEMMLPEYYPLFAELLGDIVGDGGEYGFGLDINPDLPPNELGAQIVQAAKRYIGRSYSSMDCSCLARTAYKDCGLTSMNGLSSVYMAKKCEEMGVLFTDPLQLQAGDLIFFSRFDPSRGPDYCGDTGRCGYGKCRRWLHIHHVAIYINDEFLIDSTGGRNSVQIRKHWGMDSAKWKWVCFGRPTT